MLDGASLSAIIMAGLALLSAGWGQVKHCKSGCCEIDKEASAAHELTSVRKKSD